jgi:aryl-alcohol dehydrogenase-like predicted oxidoreductase
MNPVFPKASRLGFGCASLGSRVSPKHGLAALAQAFENDVNWFDLAPSYGDGQAEVIFAGFAQGRRDRIHICTKCGIAPVAVGSVAAILRPVARRAVRLLPSLRRAVAQARPAPMRLRLTAALIHSSLEASLKRLKTDYVDVLALHDPDDRDFTDEGVAGALADILQSGKARVIGVAGTPENSLSALRCGLPVRHLQFADAPQAENLKRVKAVIGTSSNSLSLATHTVFGHGAAPPQRDKTDGLQQQLALLLGKDRGVYGPSKALNAAALRYALARNLNGVVLLSMFSSEHLRFNLQYANHSDNADTEAISRLFRRLTGQTNFD